jgi:Amidase
VGPLHGVPISVKEALNVAGMHTTWGNPAFREFAAGRDATVVARLRAAGAVVVGKTNVAMMLDDRRAPVTSEVGAVLSDAVDALARTGATVTEG